MWKSAPTATKKKTVYFDEQAVFIVWCHQESNRGHKDFQNYVDRVYNVDVLTVNTTFILYLLKYLPL